MNLKITNMNSNMNCIWYYVIMAIFNLSAIFCYSPVAAQVSDYQWATGMGGTGSEYGNGVAVDGNGNVYVAGQFAEAGADFNPGGTGGVLISAGGNDAFIAKYAPSGAFLWAKSMGGTGSENGRGIAVDGNGNAYVIGQFAVAGADFNPGGPGGALTSAGSNDAFLVKYDSSGAFLWAKNMGGTGNDNANAVAVDGNGNVYVTGVFPVAGANFNIGGTGGALSSAGSNDVFVAKYDPSGAFLWAKNMGGTGSDNGNALAVDGNGNVYVTGHFPVAGANFNIGGTGGALTSAGGIDGFVAKYDSNGAFLWAKSMGGAGGDYSYGVAVDGNDNVYTTGYIAVDGADFNPGGVGGALTSAGGNDVFVAKYDSSGAFLWAKSMGGTEGDQGWKAAVDGNDNVYITGYYLSPTADFNPGGIGGGIISAGSMDVFVAGYDSSGAFLWAKSMGGGSADQGWGVAASNSGNVYATGQFGAGGADFNPGGTGGMLTSAGNNDAFVVKLGCNDTSSSYMVIEDCSGSFTLNGTVYTTSGTYTQHMPNALDCDSTITIDLTFYEIEPVITINGTILGVTATYSTYQWIRNDTSIPGATNSTLSVNENADYQVTVTNENGCEGTSVIYTVNNLSTDNIKSIAPNITVYPNPADDIIHISSPASVNVVVASPAGKNILHLENTKAVPIKSLPTGIYFLHILDTDGRPVKVEKVIKR